LGAKFHTDAAVKEWLGQCRCHHRLCAPDETVEADTLVIAACNKADDWVARELDGSGLEMIEVGDSVAARTAVMAIYEGRKKAMEI
jgi:hypothetical protein